jgi:hypothetical protein
MSGTTSLSTGELDLILSDTILIAQEHVTDIIHQIDLFKIDETQNEYFKNTYLTKLSNDIIKFVELTTLASKLLITKKKASLPAIKESHIHLLFIIKGINQAQHKNDSFVLEDLIKYELKDNLTQWKIDHIPSIKRYLS